MARRKKSSSVKVNFKGVESRQTPPEGDYLLEVLEAENDTSSKGNDQIVFTLEIAEGKYKGTKLWFYCPLAENSLWKLHAFLTAMGVEVEEDEMDIDLSELVGLQVVGVLTHETYQGKKRAKMTDFDSAENYKGGDDEDEDEDDEDEKSSKKKSKSKKAPAKGKKGKSKSDDDEDEDEDDDEDEKPSKKSKSKKGKKSKDEDDEDEDDEDEKPSKKSKSKKSKKDEDDEDEDEDDEPKSKKGKKSKKKSKLDRDDVEDMDEDELQELIDEHDLEVDLDDYKKLPKKVAAVIEALEEEDLLDDD